jgi:hypothetical protein
MRTRRLAAHVQPAFLFPDGLAVVALLVRGSAAD